MAITRSGKIPRKFTYDLILYVLNQKGKTIPAITNHRNNKSGDKLQLGHQNEEIWHSRNHLISSVGTELKLDPSMWGPNRTSNKFPNIIDQEISKLRSKKKLIDWNSSKHFGIFRLDRLSNKLIKKPIITNNKKRSTQDTSRHTESDVSEKNLKRMFLSIIADSPKSNTYKFTLAKSLLDYCKETTEKKQKYEISYHYFASKFLKYYWYQEYKFKMKQDFRTNGKPNVIKVINNVFGNNPPADFELLKKKDVDDAERQILKNVFGTIKGKKSIVIPAFQNITTGNDSEDSRIFYDYDNPAKILYLRPEAFNFFRKNNRMLSQVVLAQWAKFLEKINHSLPRLVAKLENNDPIREPLTEYRKIYSEYVDQCFYCKNKLKYDSTHVDHFIPWSYIYDDHLWNLVLSCQKCNCKKSNSLPEEKFLDNLIDRNTLYYDHIKKLKNSLDQLDVGSGWKPVIKNHYDVCNEYGFDPIPLP